MTLVDLALAVLGAVFIMGVIRLVRGPTAADRAIAADLCFFVFIGAAALVGLRVGSTWVFDVVLAGTLTAFISTVWLARLVGGAEGS
ncbi:multisubunit Na+/H+ antiporter MnhF subunit [Lipingzhangella halophila]|uniref:Multisubunit Na+/H+ antiporter MnhF subunit n=1 Tax=Lipingzhangella halophila TaxID=1783352 RepID=A0A7W7RCG5_9ACTN|nr:monovalent cation/H+ antiporter complex subunit F [Lipingzhangella halophila]MBB4929451.1 multisubunit Na+/H+ antiporter MnhF subunit [Lipingzhangella halophila]